MPLGTVFVETVTFNDQGRQQGEQLGHFALGPTMLGAPRARQGAFSDFVTY